MTMAMRSVSLFYPNCVTDRQQESAVDADANTRHERKDRFRPATYVLHVHVSHTHSLAFIEPLPSKRGGSKDLTQRMHHHPQNQHPNEGVKRSSDPNHTQT